MKKILLFLFLLFIIGGTTYSQVNFSIEGSTDVAHEGCQVSLIMLEEDNRQADSTSVVNGKFFFKGELMQPCWAAISIDGIDAIFAVLENGNFRIYADSKEFRCEGTPTNNAFQKCMQEYQMLKQHARDASMRLDTLNIGREEKRELYLKNHERTMTQTKEFVVKTVSENLDNIIPAFWIRVCQEQITTNELNAMLVGASPVLKTNRFITKLISVQEGSHFVDAKVEQPDGTKANLSDYLGRGNYTLVNVWASWCGACIAELPAIGNAEKKYASRGLKLLSISIDRSREDWKKAFKRLDMPWAQVLGDYTFINAYGFNKIPALMLISPDGIILKRNFYVEELEEFFNQRDNLEKYER